MKCPFIGLLFCILATNVKAQKHSLFFNTQGVQIKESANYGLVNRGLNLQLGYNYEKIKENTIVNYEGDFAFGINYRKGLGMFWQLKPFEVFYGKELAENSIFGGYASANYQFQLYPELQSGHLFWFTNHEIGVKHSRIIKVRNKELKILVSSSLLGLISRPQRLAQSETLFYDLSANYIVQEQNSNFRLNTFNRFTHLNLEICQHKSKKWNFAYELNYTWIGGDAPLQYVTHSLNSYLTLGYEKKK